MGDLLQLHESGFRDGDAYDWFSGSGSVVPASNRRRILDRDRVEARADGWAYDERLIAEDDDTFIAAERFRWVDADLYTPDALEAACRPWTLIEVAPRP